MGGMAFDLDAAMDNTLRIGASDLHVKVGTAPRIRVSGRLVELPGSSPVSPEEAAAVQRQVITSEPKRAELDRNGSADASYYNGEGRLVPAARGGMALNAEVLVNSSRVRALITEQASLPEIHKAIHEGDYYGMQTFDQSLLAHVREGRVSRSEAMAYASEPHDFGLALQQADVPLGASNGR